MEGGERKLEILSGKSYGSNQRYSKSMRCGGGATHEPPFTAESTRASHSGAPSVPKPWSFNDADAKRRKRLARYKVYTVEGKVKATLSKGFRWIKNKCSHIVHAY